MFDKLMKEINELKNKQDAVKFLDVIIKAYKEGKINDKESTTLSNALISKTVNNCWNEMKEYR